MWYSLVYIILGVTRYEYHVYQTFETFYICLILSQKYNFLVLIKYSKSQQKQQQNITAPCCYLRPLRVLPRQGSFLTRNSSRATQPPPTRTITVLLRIRTRRNFCDSPNWNERRILVTSSKTNLKRNKSSTDKIPVKRCTRCNDVNRTIKWPATLRILTYAIFSFTNLVYAELFSTGTLWCLSFNFILNPSCFRYRFTLVSVRSQRSNKFLIIDVSISVSIKYISNCLHLEFGRWEFWILYRNSFQQPKVIIASQLCYKMVNVLLVIKIMIPKVS